VLNEVDFLILEIIGKDTAVVEGLAIGESGKPAEEQLMERDENHNPAAENSTSMDQSNSSGSKKNVKRRYLEDSTHIQKKIDLQIELMEIKIYKHRLEALQLEKEIGIPRSKFTNIIFS